MEIIVTVDKHWGIGWKGKPLVQIPADFRFFKEQTAGKVVVMSRKTLESFPGGKATLGRTNLVLTSSRSFSEAGITIVHSMEELKSELAHYDSKDIYLIGGERLYKEFLPVCDVVHATCVDYEYQADAFFENLDCHDDWVLEEESEEQTYYNLEYYFRRYKRDKER